MLDILELESKAERFQGVFIRPGKSGGRHSRHSLEGVLRSQDDALNSRGLLPRSAGANASLATRMARCIAPQQLDGDKGDKGDGGDDGESKSISDGNDEQAQVSAMAAGAGYISSKTAADAINMSTASSSKDESESCVSPIRKGFSDRTRAGILASGKRMSGDGPMVRGAAVKPLYNMSDNSANKVGEVSFPFGGRTLMSADWISRHSAGGAGGGSKIKHGMKPMTAGSWKQAKHTAEAALVSVPGAKSVRGDTNGSSSDSSRQRENGSTTRSERGKRGRGRGWEGLYQVRPFDHETPPSK